MPSTSSASTPSPGTTTGRASRPGSSPSRYAAMATLMIGALAATSAVTAAPAAAALPETVPAAAYLGADDAAETSLPATVSDGTTDHAVSWDVDADMFAVPYSTVEVNGTVDGESITAVVEVIPPAEHPLAYFVDAGHGGDSQDRWYSSGGTTSQAFTAVGTLAADTLLNTAPDQPFDPENPTWGYLYENPTDYKISVPGGDPAEGTDLSALGKDELGVRTNSDHLTFGLALDPGTYTLTSGFYEFYAAGNNRFRQMDPTLTYTVDGDAQSQTLDRIALSTSANQAEPIQNTSAFTIPAGASDLTLSYAQSGGEGPILSWFAIAAGDAEEVIDDALSGDESDAVEVTIDAADIPADNVNGLTFKGFGTLSANSTSAVLLDSKSEHPQAYAELIRTLFGGEHPIMNHVKIEMGNDRNNSTGPDVATMRTADEPANVTRHPGFQLAADALAVNPDLQVSILRWTEPGWVDSNDDIYTWYTNTILAAYREYGYMVDYVNPGVNEHSADLAWTQEYAERVRTDTTGYISDDPALAGFRDGEAELFHQIQVVIADEVGVGTFGDELVADAALQEAVDVAAYHYSPNDDGNGNFTRLAEEFDMQVWNSEAQATFSNTAFRPNNNTADPTVAGTGIGGHISSLEMANTIVKGFVNSRRSHFIYQPAIGSFYEGGQYSFKELVSARDPWSGWMHYDGGLAVLQHFSSFAVTGWENEDNTAGIWRGVPEASAAGATGTNPVVGRNGAPNYLTLAAPDGSDFSTVIVNDSEQTLTYRLNPEGFGLDGDALAVWETRAAGDGEAFNAHYKQHVGDVTPDGGAYVVEIAPFSMTTVTSLDVTGDEGWTTPLPVESERTVLDAGLDSGEGVLWSDDFDYTERTIPQLTAEGQVSTQTDAFVEARGGETGAIPLFTWDRNGAFEAYLDGEEWVLRQQVDTEATGVGGAWNGGDPITAIGDRRWTNYRATVDVRFERETTDGNYAAVGARSSGGDNSQSLNTTPYVLRLERDGGWQFLRMGTVTESGSIGDIGAEWHELSLQVAGDQITGWIDGEQVVDWTDPAPIGSGWVDLASGFHHTQFDNLSIEQVESYLPYYGGYLDNLEMTDLSDPPATQLAYSGSWNHAVSGSMYEYQRSTSRTSEAGARMGYTFTGSGLDVLGVNDGSARLEVRVDGELVEPAARTQASGQFEQTYVLRGLAHGEHTVSLEVLSGSLTVDAVAIHDGVPSVPADVTQLAEVLEAAEQIERTDDFTDAGWEALQNAIASAEQAVTDPAGYGLDAEGATQLADRLRAGSAPLWDQIVSVEDVRVATLVGVQPELPETVAVTLVDESTREIAVEWPADVNVSEAWASATVAGQYGGATIPAFVEVIPSGVVAFADINGTEGGSLGYTSPSYEVISDSAELVNETPDQPFDGTWGHAGQNSGGSEEVNFKGIVDGDYSKLTTTGMYTSNAQGSQLSYTFTLPAGDYELAAGSHSWWADNARTADVVLSYDGEEHVVDSVTLDSGSPSALLAYDVELEADGPVTLTLRNTSSQSPMLSWVGVARAEPTLTGIEVTSLPDRVEYTQGEELDLTGLEVTASYSDGVQTVLDNDALAVTGYDPETLGGQEITVLYTETAPPLHTRAVGDVASATFEVTVVATDAGSDAGADGADGGSDGSDSGADGGSDGSDGTDAGSAADGSDGSDDSVGSGNDSSAGSTSSEAAADGDGSGSDGGPSTGGDELPVSGATVGIAIVVAIMLLFGGVVLVARRRGSAG
ncbi:bacterial Ig-like domain-containing protein [Ruania halotolerans]|uniref:bacterial Ig-like domain-containing protein n=1 Tax=Ruania halotolerans TaxID=2897773 RepID=UPI001E3D34AD|nr:bacterial Ig-like domain-containing protein [Ruania halotolerans]UFU06350.1 bacterial Ig-like domain-containing protein [Ruania halotolerans]